LAAACHPFHPNRSVFKERGLHKKADHFSRLVGHEPSVAVHFHSARTYYFSQPEMFSSIFSLLRTQPTHVNVGQGPSHTKCAPFLRSAIATRWAQQRTPRFDGTHHYSALHILPLGRSQPVHPLFCVWCGFHTSLCPTLDSICFSLNFSQSLCSQGFAHPTLHQLLSSDSLTQAPGVRLPRGAESSSGQKEATGSNSSVQEQGNATRQHTLRTGGAQFSRLLHGQLVDSARQRPATQGAAAGKRAAPRGRSAVLVRSGKICGGVASFYLNLLLPC